ncbi:tRNA (guanine(46)-N(7))-methyltransferase TrmB [Shimazuella kribbensis]|uniref:tRNA (guanine(46)-N(7))-methyltransferase TrmB n=1 Tax=Shimazuella kribbensis TaxID=139808 RepID=UPI0004180A61|nr:hypothetical protein [Shimazuella kribbensis]
MGKKQNNFEKPILIGKEAKIVSPIRNLFQTRKFPLYVDLGTGNGMFVRKAAKKYPEINWIGIENNAKDMVRASSFPQQKNIRFIWMRVEQLKQVFAEGEVNRFYLQFCTPIDDSNWKHKQMTYYRFLDIYRELLARDGDLIFKTDHAGLYAFTLKQIEKGGWKIVNELQDYASSNLYDKQLSTDWEQQMINTNTSIYYLRLRPINRRLT